MIKRASRVLLSLAGVAAVTWACFRYAPQNPTLAGFAYLLLVLVVAASWGFADALVASLAATLSYNFFFLPPIGRLTIATPDNWVALFSFLASALLASRLSTQARRRALEAASRQRDLERLYSFSRAILLMDRSDVFSRQLARKLSEVFKLDAVALYDRRDDATYRAGPSDLDMLDEPLRQSALRGTNWSDPGRHRTITTVRLGSQPIAGLAMAGAAMPDAVVQGIANLVAIGLERARAQELAVRLDAARQAEALRRSLLDALAHEFQTPLTSVLAATSALLAGEPPTPAVAGELLQIAHEEALRLRELVTDTIEMGRLDSAEISPQPEAVDVAALLQELITSLHSGHDQHPVTMSAETVPGAAVADRRLLRLALKQILDNAMKYSPPDQPIAVRVFERDHQITVEVTDGGAGIPPLEQERIFERLYRSPAVARQVPGTGLGLSIARSIVRAHGGDLTVASRPGETTFRLRLPLEPAGAGQ